MTPELAALARAVGARDAERLGARLASRRTRVWLRSGDDFPIRDADGLPDMPAALLGEGDRPDAFAWPRVAIVGDARGDAGGAGRRARARRDAGPGRHHRGERARDRDRRCRARRRARRGRSHGGRRRDRARRRLPAPARHAVHARARARARRRRARLRCAAVAVAVPDPQSHHRRVVRRGRRGRGDERRRCSHHCQLRRRVRPPVVRAPGFAPQSGGGRLQRADRRGRDPGARPHERVGCPRSRRHRARRLGTGARTGRSRSARGTARLRRTRGEHRRARTAPPHSRSHASAPRYARSNTRAASSASAASGGRGDRRMLSRRGARRSRASRPCTSPSPRWGAATDSSCP